MKRQPSNLTTNTEISLVGRYDPLIGDRWTITFWKPDQAGFYNLVLILISESGCYNYATGLSQPLNGSPRVFLSVCLV